MAHADDLRRNLDELNLDSKYDDSKPSRWDAPPQEEPAGPSYHPSPLLLIQVRIIPQGWSRKEVTRMLFSPSDSMLAVEMHGRSHVESFNEVLVYRTQNYAAGPIQHLSAKAMGAFAFANPPDVALVAAHTTNIANETPFNSHPTQWLPANHVEIFDLANSRRRAHWERAVLAAPLAWSLLGTRIAGVSTKDKTRILLVDPQTQQIKAVIPHHMDEVTHLEFMPDGRGLVSVAKDGCIRLSDPISGGTLKKFEVESKWPPRLLQVSGDGNIIASVWGKDVMLWYPESGEINAYSLNAVRQIEGWPLAISPDCRYLGCRTETGFEVSDLITGKSLGETVLENRAFITAAAFNSDGHWLAIGTYSGTMQLLEIVTSQ